MKLIVPADVAPFRIPSETAAAPTLIFANTGSRSLAPYYRDGLREPRVIVQNKTPLGWGRDVLDHERFGRENPLRMNWKSIPVISYWILWFQAKKALRELHKKYDPQIEAAEKSRKEDEIGFAYSAFSDEFDEILEPLRRRNSAKAIMRAAKLGIPVPRYTTQTSSDWRQSMTDGKLYLSDDAVQKLRREIREEQRSNYDESRKWATAILAVGAFILALVSLLVKQKQPDPCARNYYRNDAGACVFALTPQHQIQTPQTKSQEPQVKPVAKGRSKKTARP